MKEHQSSEKLKRAVSSRFYPALTALLLVVFGSCGSPDAASPEAVDPPSNVEPAQAPPVIMAKAQGDFEARHTAVPVVIDGQANDSIWANLDWYAMQYAWMGGEVDPNDYQGKFKLAWDQQHLYVLVEVVDDVLNPTLANGLENYWKGDYVEVFIDEDHSGGDHKFNHQAFAYHVSTEGHAIDLKTTGEPIFFDDHVQVQRTQEGQVHLWEMAIRLYNDQLDENTTTNIPVAIVAQKTIGFSIAYGDNDGQNMREHFMGSKETHGVNNDEGYVNADVFGSVVFVQ